MLSQQGSASVPHPFRLAQLRLGAGRLLRNPFEISRDPGITAEIVQRRQAKHNEIAVGIKRVNLPVASLAQQCGRELGTAFFPGNQMMYSSCKRGTAAQLTLS